ncbi:MAG TPA: BTAD domain-containing putative transcriptional regulator [Nocardioides sp.]|nr:BTAD domain-containing putative transcriptional regulator [Nocardioides sp.]
MADGEPLFRALGPLEVRIDGGMVDLGPAKQRALLAVLLALAPDVVPVERLVDELWPHGGPGQPLRSLQVYVSALRRAMGPEGRRLTTVGRGYRLEVPDRGFDIDLFEDRVATSQEEHRAGEHEAAVATADAAQALWRGQAWQDVRGVPVIEPDAARLEELRLDLRATRAAALLALGRHRDQVPELEGLVRLHPLREDLRGNLMLALHRSGRQAEALEVYADGRVALADEAGLDPGTALRDLHAAILGDDPNLRLEDADLRARRHLPAPATALIGRRADRDELVRLLTDGTRLLTLTGPGGVGKTRLALHLAHEMAGACPDGVWFIELADLDDVRLVAPTVAESLGVDLVGEDAVTPLVDHVAGRRLLLVLDNFEQVEPAADLVARLLGAGGGVQVVVTSRVPLRVYGEHVWQLGPMAVDDAVALFSARATAADHRFDGRRVATIERICAGLDRLPLAIELAAARVSEMTLDEMADHLAARLDLASDGPPERSGRQRALRATIGWSADLLPSDTATALGRLGVFAGGFQADAAEAVGVGRQHLTVLVRSSLLVREADRFRLLETIRDYALELLAHDPDRAGVRDRHAAYHLALAEQARPGMTGTSSAALIRRLRAERANLRAAMEHDQQAGAWVDLLRLATALTIFWYRTGVRNEDLAWVELALGRAFDADDHLRGRAFYGLAICRGEQGRSEEAMAACTESHRLLQATGDDAWLARVLNSLAGLTRDAGHAAAAAPMVDEVIALRRRLADPALSLRIPLHNRAIVAMDLGDLATARWCLAEERELAAGDELEEAWVDSTLADLAITDARTEEARSLLRSALPVLRAHDAESRLVELLDSLAALAVTIGRLPEAAVLVGAADRAMADTGAVQVHADVLLRQRRVGRMLDEMLPDDRSARTREGAELDLREALDLATDWLL